MRTCTKCKLEKSLEDFPKNEKLPQGRKSSCKDCVNEQYNARFRDPDTHDRVLKQKQEWRRNNREKARETNRLWRATHREHNRTYKREWKRKNKDKARSYEYKTKYKITLEQFNELLISQDYRCLICNDKYDSNTTKRHFSVDHDHISGKVRGILCNRCNRAMGYFNDNADLLLKAAAYLHMHEPEKAA